MVAFPLAPSQVDPAPWKPQGLLALHPLRKESGGQERGRLPDQGVRGFPWHCPALGEFEREELSELSELGRWEGQTYEHICTCSKLGEADFSGAGKP